jgi:hypothetical protein
VVHVSQVHASELEAVDLLIVGSPTQGALPTKAIQGLLDKIGAPLTETVLATQVADTIIIPTWIIGGILLWRRTELGYVAGLGLLFQGSMLFIAVIVVVLLRPLLSTVPFNPADVVALVVMGLVCFVPLGLFLRAVARGGRR